VLATAMQPPCRDAAPIEDRRNFHHLSLLKHAAAISLSSRTVVAKGGALTGPLTDAPPSVSKKNPILFFQPAKQKLPNGRRAGGNAV
jgi:hypothetical protein